MAITMHKSLLILAFFTFQSEPNTQQLSLLKTFRQEFVEITPGKGSFPKHKSLNAYSIGKFEVPQNLWESVMGANPSRWKGPRNSVERLSFVEANAFCAKATQLLRSTKLITAAQEVRLPYEDEWEYAARAGTKTDYSFGDDLGKLDDYAWSTRNAAGNDPAVGALKPNPWGLYDVHGYLWEWCLMRADKSEATGKAKADSSSKSKPKVAVLRSGSWKDNAEKLKTSFRLVVNQSDRDDAVGFRCVLASVVASKTK